MLLGELIDFSDSPIGGYFTHLALFFKIHSQPTHPTNVIQMKINKAWVSSQEVPYLTLWHDVDMHSIILQIHHLNHSHIGTLFEVEFQSFPIHF